MSNINNIIYQTLLEIQNLDSTPVGGNLKSLSNKNNTTSIDQNHQKTPSNQIHNSPAPGVRKLERDSLKIHGVNGKQMPE